jgi:hypothetical protein
MSHDKKGTAYLLVKEMAHIKEAIKYAPGRSLESRLVTRNNDKENKEITVKWWEISGVF